MDYDLVIIGAGPGGLTAAREAGKLGIKTMVVEKKQKPWEMKRLCSQLMKFGKSGFASAFTPTDKPINAATCNIEVDLQVSKVLIHNPEITIPYSGYLHFYHNARWVSPNGSSFTLFPSNELNYGYLIDKEALLSGLLEESTKAGVKVMPGTKCIDIDNQTNGVSCTLSPEIEGGTTQVIRARRCILADGSFSPIMEKLGLNKGRTGPPALKFLAYVLDCVDKPYPDTQYVYASQPSLHHGHLLVASWPHGLNYFMIEAQVTHPGSLTTIADEFMTKSVYASWFKRSKVVKKITCNMALVSNIWNPATGSLICVGDNAAYAETAIKGAIAGGFMAAQATRMALEGKDGNSFYNKYWDTAFPSHSPQYRVATRRSLPPTSQLNDQEMDTLYKWIADHNINAMLADAVNNNMESIKSELPGIYEKIKLPVAPG